MDTKLLSKLFGREPRWQGACTLILDAEAGIQTLGADSIGASATKSYAPRLVSGRIMADSVCLMEDGSALLVVQQHKQRQATGEETVKQSLIVIDPARIVAVEFLDTAPLAALGMATPMLRGGSHPGTSLRPSY